MIKRDLILSDNGDVILVQDLPFARTVVRVEFYRETGYLILIHDNEDSTMVEFELTDTAAINALTRSPRILLTHLENGEPADGFDVPLISVGA